MRWPRTVVVMTSLLVVWPTSAWPVEYSQMQPGKGTLSFVSRQMGVPVEGRFTRYAAQLSFDPARPEKARAVLDIELGSIDVGAREVYDEVVGKNWFNVRQFPLAHFESSAVRALGGNRYEVRGPLNIKGKTREVVAPFSIVAAGKAATFEGAFAIKRLEFGIGEGAWGDPDTVADDVQVKFKFIVGESVPPKKVAPVKPVQKRRKEN